MPSPRLIHFVELLLLCTLVLSVALLTCFAITSSLNRAGCPPIPPDISSALKTNSSDGRCSAKENISKYVNGHSSLFQSAHIFFVTTTIAFSLLVLRSALRAMTWTALNESITLGALQRAIAFDDSPSLTSAFRYARHGKSVSSRWAVRAVFLIALFSTTSPFIIGFIYQTHEGPLHALVSISVGGSVGPNMSLTFNATAPVGGGIAAAREFLNTATGSNTSFPNLDGIPFIPQKVIKHLWHAEVDTIVARRLRVDCGPSAPRRVWNGSEDIVTLGPEYFTPNNVSQPHVQVSFAGLSLGYISNDPHVTAVYLNTSLVIEGGSIQAETTVIFLAADGTMEGAHQTIRSPTPSSRVAFVDVLVCTSVIHLEVSRCTIEKGATSACVPAVHPGINLDQYMHNPVASAIALAASPVTSCYQLADRLPMWNYIKEPLLQSGLPPISFLSLDIPYTDPYHMSLAYIDRAFFSQTMYALVQGMTTVWPVYQDQPVMLTVMFATSHYELAIFVLVVVVVWAVVVAIGSCWARRRDRVAHKLDVMRLAYMWRPRDDGVRVEDVFPPSVGSDGELGEGIAELRASVNLNGSRIDVFRDAQEDVRREAQTPNGHMPEPVA